MNSLLQALFMTPELRNGLFKIDVGSLGLQADIDPKGNSKPPAPASGRNQNADAAAKKKYKKKKERVVPLELQKLFTMLQEADEMCVSTSDLTSKGFSWQDYDGREQHDVHELSQLLLDPITEHTTS